ncbi:hypothetical protein, partial [Chamaesiphon sp. OTE_75_metabat_556]|uniref:hypothetical protein n=1 Tax=Chamaesiphon sp. OTE_75_metabat_556 TaxID=2964692 RepID=UPI00286CF86B
AMATMYSRNFNVWSVMPKIAIASTQLQKTTVVTKSFIALLHSPIVLFEFQTKESWPSYLPSLPP